MYVCMYGTKSSRLEFLETSFFDNNLAMLLLFGKEENKLPEFIRFTN